MASGSNILACPNVDDALLHIPQHSVGTTLNNSRRMSYCASKRCPQNAVQNAHTLLQWNVLQDTTASTLPQNMVSLLTYQQRLPLSVRGGTRLHNIYCGYRGNRRVPSILSGGYGYPRTLQQFCATEPAGLYFNRRMPFWLEWHVALHGHLRPNRRCKRLKGMQSVRSWTHTCMHVRVACGSNIHACMKLLRRPSTTHTFETCCNSPITGSVPIHSPKPFKHSSDRPFILYHV